MLADTCNKILSLTNLEPTEETTSLFRLLDEEIVEAPADTKFTLADEDARQLRYNYAVVEGLQESKWVKEILASSTPEKTLMSYPYLVSYTDLIQKELDLLKVTGLTLTNSSRVLIIGTGPLPMTAYLIHKATNAIIDHVDIDGDAIHDAHEFTSIFGIQGECIQSPGENYNTNHVYDLILIASLAGSNTQEKQEIISNTISSLKPTGRFLLRSSHGLKSLVYPEVHKEHLKGVELLIDYHPDGEVLNSVLLFQKRAI